MTSRAPPWLGNALVLALLATAALGLLALHPGAWSQAPPPVPRRWLAAAAALTYLAACAMHYWRHRARPARAAASTPGTVWVAWASQTGFGHELAKLSAQTLAAVGCPTELLPLHRLDPSRLQPGQQVLFIASTTGEGDPPDHALPFLRQAMAQSPALGGLRYAVLALGDRGYGHFCGFARQLEQWLQHCGAHALFDRIEVDNADPDALRQWQSRLAALGNQPSPLPDWERPRYQSWRLAQREHVNPGSAGGEVHRLTLLPASGAAPDWRAGDIAEVGPRHARPEIARWLGERGLAIDAVANGVSLLERLRDCQLPGPGLPWDEPALQPLPHREYSIASIPAEGCLQLLVRLQHDAEGRPGLGSGWLCRHAQVGDAIALRIRANPNFHAPPIDKPLILVGNGTGIAGLRALLRERIQAGARANWLLFGERQRAHDRPFDQDLENWLREGWLQRLDRVYSRDDGPGEGYVQHRLRAQAERLRAWIDDGACLYVCGSLRGMAPALEQVLDDVLGAALREHLLLQGRYRRDVY